MQDLLNGVIPLFGRPNPSIRGKFLLENSLGLEWALSRKLPIFISAQAGNQQLLAPVYANNFVIGLPVENFGRARPVFAVLSNSGTPRA